jgi:hypothetical protein
LEVAILDGDSRQEDGRVAIATKGKACAGVTVCGVMDSFKSISGNISDVDSMLGICSSWQKFGRRRRKQEVDSSR